MAAMTGKEKGLLIAATVLLVIVGVFCGILFGTELIQQKVIELMCPDTPSSTPRDYDAITAGTSLKTVEYASGQQADVIAPKEGASSNIVVVYFHGGYYVGGGRHNQEPYCRYLASNGYTVLNCDYTLATEEKWPAQIKDAAAAFEYAATAFEGASLVVAGDSAGAHLAAQLAAVVSDSEFAKTFGIDLSAYRDRLVGMIGNCGYYEASSVAETGFFLIENSLRILLDDRNYLIGEAVKTMDVTKHVSAFPPTLLLCGDKDDFLSQNLLMEQALKAAGRDVGTYFPQTKDNALGHEFHCIIDLLLVFNCIPHVLDQTRFARVYEQIVRYLAHIKVRCHIGLLLLPIFAFAIEMHDLARLVYKMKDLVVERNANCASACCRVGSCHTDARVQILFAYVETLYPKPSVSFGFGLEQPKEFIKNAHYHDITHHASI